MSVPSNLIPTRITQLPDAPVASEDGLLLFVYNGNSYKVRAGDLLSSSGVPPSRQVIAGTGLTGGGQLTENITLSVAPKAIDIALLSDTGTSTGTFGSDVLVPQLTVNSAGQIVSITNVPISSSGGIVALDQGGTGNNLTAVDGGIAYSDASGIQLSVAGSDGQVLVSGGTGAPTWGSALIVSDQSANVVYAGPSSGPPDATSFRSLVNADLPASGVTAATYGSATKIPQLVINAQGVITSASELTFSAATVTSVSVASANGFAGTVANPTTTPAITISTTVTGLLKGNGTAISAAVTNTDYQSPIGTISGIAKGNGANALTSAVAGTDYSAGTSALATGILKSTTTTGALTIAVAADFPTLNQDTTGTAASATVATNIAGGTAGQMLYQSGSDTTAFIANGTAGEVLTSTGASSPAWGGISGGTF